MLKFHYTKELGRVGSQQQAEGAEGVMKKTQLLGLVWVVVMVLASTSQAQTTGWNKTAAGLYDYNDSANWVGGTINGVWDSSLTLLGIQTNTFGAGGTTLSTGLNFGYTGGFNLFLRSDGVVNRTITLGGDITVNPVNNQTITFGSATANQGLNVDLGGAPRVLTVAASKLLVFLNALTNGNLSIVSTPNTATAPHVKLSGANGGAAYSDIDVSSHGLLGFDSSAVASLTGLRAQSVALKNTGRLLVTGQNGVNTTDTISGNLIIDGAGIHTKGNYPMSSVTTDAGTKYTLLTVNELQRTNRGTMFFRGDNLGVNTIASATAGASNIKINGAQPTLIGGVGAAGTTTISIIPWAVGGTTVLASPMTFVTSTAENGLRPLDTASEFAAIFGGNATDNVQLTNTTATSLASDTTVNSLILAGVGGAVSGPGALTVTSGAILMPVASTPITAPLKFGSAEGVFHYNRGNVIGGVVDGSGGITVNGHRSDEILQFTNGACTYTGDTTVLANMQVVGGVLPSGSRAGNVYVYGNLQLSVAGFIGAINGLFGNGTVSYGNSGVSAISIGDNDATSLFTGTLAGNANLDVSKIGAGTLTMTGSNTNARVMSILGGTLAVSVLADGGTASGIGSSASTAANLVINGGKLKYIGPATSSDRLFQAGGTTDGGVATLDASGTGPVNFSNRGSLAYGTVGSTGTAQTRQLVLAGTNTGSNTLSAAIGKNGIAVNGNSAVSLTKTDSGTWVLAGTNSYNGATTISNGTLAINGSIVSPVTIWSNGVLSGTGWIATNATAVTVKAGGIIDPGTVGGAGTLTVTGNVDFAIGGKLRLDAGVGGADRLNVVGSVTAASSTVTVSVNAVGEGPWVVMTATSIGPTFLPDSPDYVLNKDGGTLTLYRGVRGTTLIIQ